jgi:hypothetical protein
LLPIKSAHAAVSGSKIEICYGAGSIALKGSYGRYMNSKHGDITAGTSTSWGGWESFNFEHIGNENGEEKVYIRNLGGLYLTVHMDGSLFFSELPKFAFQIEKIPGNGAYIKMLVPESVPESRAELSNLHICYITFNESGKVVIERRYEHKDLHRAIQIGHTEVIEELLQAPWANINRSLLGKTPLLLAAFHGRTAIVKKLVQKGADMFARDNDGNTSLHLAAKHGHVDAVEELIIQMVVNGLDLQVKNKEGKTALQLANEAGKTQVVERLRLWIETNL